MEYFLTPQISILSPFLFYQFTPAYLSDHHRATGVCEGERCVGMSDPSNDALTPVWSPVPDLVAEERCIPSPRLHPQNSLVGSMKKPGLSVSPPPLLVVRSAGLEFVCQQLVCEWSASEATRSVSVASLACHLWLDTPWSLHLDLPVGGDSHRSPLHNPVDRLSMSPPSFETHPLLTQLLSCISVLPESTITTAADRIRMVRARVYIYMCVCVCMTCFCSAMDAHSFTVCHRSWCVCS